MEDRYFENALSNFVFDMAGGSAIRHMADKGYTVKHIKESLEYPVSYEKIQKTVWEHLLDKKVILVNVPGTNIIKDNIVYVEKYGKYGRKSFSAVVIPDKDYKRTGWKVNKYNYNVKQDFSGYISEKCNKNGRETAYVSCSFGILKKDNPGRFKTIMEVLDSRQREYIEGLLWPYKCVYHRLNLCMQEIISILVGQELYNGACYFIELEEKVLF